MWEKAPVAHKKQSAALKQYQLHDKRQGDPSTKQSKKVGERREHEKKLSVTEQREGTEK